MLKREKSKQPSVEDKPTIISAGQLKDLKKKSKKVRKDELFVRILNRLLNFDCLQ